jgi:hypothetical protein
LAVEDRSDVLPGGPTLVHQDLATVAQPALAPLMPLFDIIDAVVTAIGVVQAIPDALGPPPDPSGLLSLMPKLVEKLEKLLTLVPQLSVPLTAVGLVDGVITALEQARSQLVALMAQAERIATAQARAAELGDPDLARLVGCAQDSLAQETANVGRSLGPVGGVLGILRLLLGLIGGPEVPDLSSMDGLPLDGAIAALDELIAALRTVRDAIPLP